MDEKLLKELQALEAKLAGQLDEKTKKEVEAQIKALKESIEKSNNEAIEKLKGEIEKTADELKQFKAEAGRMKTENTVKTFAEELKESKESLSAAMKDASGKTEVHIKANVTRASIATNVHQLEIPGIGQLARKARSLYDLFPKVPVSPGNHKGTIAYTDWDEATVVKAAAMVAEGAAFPESTAAFKGYTLALRKVGDILPVSEEFFEDEQLAAAELELFLDANVEAKIDDQIVNGDNTGENLKGLVSSIVAYAPVASGITDANIYDLATKVAENITSTGGAKYRPDFVAMNIADINKLNLKKDSTNNYVFDRADGRVQSLNIIEDNNVAANTMIVGDSRFARIYEMGGVMLSRGYINAQFTTDYTTLKARKRLAFLIREADKTGFKKVTSISAALVTLAT